MFSADDLKSFTTTEQGSTAIVACPPGEYVGIISDKLEFRQSAGRKDPSKMYTFLDASIEIDDARAREVTGRDKVSVRYSCLVDLSADGRGLDMSKGKNIGLNRLREAVGQNTPGRPWSPSMLIGQAVKAKVKNVPDANDPSILRDEVEAVAPLA